MRDASSSPGVHVVTRRIMSGAQIHSDSLGAKKDARVHAASHIDSHDRPVGGPLDRDEAALDPRSFTLQVPLIFVAVEVAADGADLYVALASHLMKCRVRQEGDGESASRIQTKRGITHILSCILGG